MTPEQLDNLKTIAANLRYDYDELEKDIDETGHYFYIQNDLEWRIEQLEEWVKDAEVAQREPAKPEAGQLPLFNED